MKKGTWFEEDAPEAIQDVDGHIQQKILPWDKLELVRRRNWKNIQRGSRTSLKVLTKFDIAVVAVHHHMLSGCRIGWDNVPGPINGYWEIETVGGDVRDARGQGKVVVA